MQEELTMDKTKNRPLQPHSKNASNDKKSQDVSNIKSVSRGGRRRESPGGFFSSKNDARKSIPQCNKNVDKRPRPRGSYYTGAMDGNARSGVVNEEAEFGSVLVPGSKKQNLNHLLNFHFEPRDIHWRSNTGSVSHKSGGRLISTHKHKYNKEQFLQAHCQFIVTAGADYKLYLNNPDALVNWNLIEQVKINVIEFPSCPICLYPPTAAKMTRCGHIYCWPCILHYLALSDKAWRKCPICFESIHKKDLKSVVPVPHSHFNTSEEITFNLMKKLRGSLKVCPIDEICSEIDLPKVSELGSRTLYSKFLLAEKADVFDIVLREKNELELQLKEDCPEKCFVSEALQLLADRESLIFNENEATEQTPPVNIEKHDSNELNTENGVPFDNSVKNEFNLMEGVNSMNKKHENLENISAEDLEISSSSAQKLSKYFFFYQASDGQHIYLHSLNIKMLEHTYGSLENCPKTITGKIVEKESGSMTEDLRKRLRYLQHLPISCPFEVAEIKLMPPVVSLDTIITFNGQIELRRKRRNKREKEEKLHEKRIAKEQDMKMGKFRSANIRIESHRQFPDFCLDQAEGLPRDDYTSPYSERSHSPVSISNSSVSSTPLSTSWNRDGETTALSFAKMLSLTKPRTNSESEPRPTSSGSGGAVAAKTINVTGSQTKSVFMKKTSGRHSDSEPEPEEYVPASAFNRSFGDAIALALEKAAITNDNDNNSRCQQGGKKKKKNKHKVLFATSMAFSGN